MKGKTMEKISIPGVPKTKSFGELADEFLANFEANLAKVKALISGR